MQVERKFKHQSSARRWHRGPMGPLQFDGYSTVAHFVAEDGSDVRVTFERHEAEALWRFIDAELHRQRERLKNTLQAPGNDVAK